MQTHKKRSLRTTGGGISTGWIPFLSPNQCYSTEGCSGNLLTDWKWHHYHIINSKLPLEYIPNSSDTTSIITVQSQMWAGQSRWFN